MLKRTQPHGGLWLAISFILLIFGYSPHILAEVPSAYSQHLPATTTATRCENYPSGHIVDVESNMSLSPQCNYNRVTFRITRSDVTFDCRGALLNGLNQARINPVNQPYAEHEQPMGQGILLLGAESQPLSNITIQNCKIHNYVDGIRINFNISDANKQALKSGQNHEALENHLRTLAPNNLLLRNLHIKNSHKHGIYVNRYVSRLILLSSIVEGSGNSGVYLESGTQLNLIQKSRFNGNGFFNYSYETRSRSFKKQETRREAIAVDSSAANWIEDNHFKRNAAGSIFLYKNCYEHHERAEQLPRFQASIHNTIVNNRFEKEAKAIWIASRQSRNLVNFDCGDAVVHEETYDLIFKRKYYRDYASNTRVLNNHFNNTWIGIQVEDDHTTISGNTFVGRSPIAILLGSYIRGMKTNDPVHSTTVADNRFSAQSLEPIRIKYGSKPPQAADNLKGSSDYRIPCTTPFEVPAQDATGKTCRMISSINKYTGVSVRDGAVFSVYDTTKENNPSGVWGKGEYVCENGNWVKRSGYCCFGRRCGAD